MITIFFFFFFFFIFLFFFLVFFFLFFFFFFWYYSTWWILASSSNFRSFLTEYICMEWSCQPHTQPPSRRPQGIPFCFGHLL